MRVGPQDGDGSNLRGMGERLALMNVDEFFFLKPAVYSTVFPLLKNGAALMMTSSQAMHADHVLQRVVEAKYKNGESVMMQLNWIQSCIKCKLEGNAHTCQHIVQQPQHFQQRAQDNRVRTLIDVISEESTARELDNVTGRSLVEHVFEKSYLDPLYDRSQDVAYDMPISHVFVGIDPAGGGFSQSVIISGIFDRANRPPGAAYTFIVLSLSLSLFSYILPFCFFGRRRLALS